MVDNTEEKGTKMKRKGRERRDGGGRTRKTSTQKFGWGNYP
jgi:hypothetical protein